MCSFTNVKGEDKSIVKVEKLPLTPVKPTVTRTIATCEMVNDMPASTVKPVWLIIIPTLQKRRLDLAEVLLYVQNKDNTIFRLRYRFDMGTRNNKKLRGPAAAFTIF